MEGYEYLAALLKALGHPVRLQILSVLRQGEACVCHLEAVLGQRQAYISQHLMRLREDQLVTDRREGMNVFYALADKSIERLLDVAQETATTLTQAKGRHVPFSLPNVDTSLTCTCPKCLPRVADAQLAYHP